MMNLNEHGAACRCLLRARENEGLPAMSDATFITRFLPRFPEWRERPGIVDASAIGEIARSLGLAERIEDLSDYDDVLRAHQQGRSVLVRTQRAPEQVAGSSARPYVMLLVEIDADVFTVWCPYPSGQSENLPAAARRWWEQWDATGMVLLPAAVGAGPH